MVFLLQTFWMSPIVLQLGMAVSLRGLWKTPSLALLSLLRLQPLRWRTCGYIRSCCCGCCCYCCGCACELCCANVGHDPLHCLALDLCAFFPDEDFLASLCAFPWLSKEPKGPKIEKYQSRLKFSNSLFLVGISAPKKNI